MNLFKNSVLGVGVVEGLAYGTALACFAAVCVAVASERPAAVLSPQEFYRAVDRVCVQVWKDSSAEIRRYWPDAKGDAATELRKSQHYFAVKAGGAKDVLKGATGVRAVPGGAASAREEFLAAVRRYAEAGERFSEDGARSLALMIVLDNTRNAVRDLAVRNESHACTLVV
ncbi:hypothetical protein [Amycolatopsis oliviviridis]|uniref:Uncharacterized protein n=1 Tax=Amycolatopsis oliviviridis TaxID=1471590 RepID=A0ABQ3M2B7_9PSEU|nr:hypothetical protein [Amycolatopsis oliviviridis]GHH31834.1 hypothetical protein GCM10017790_68100 [Amycolatopsis oliviviridis]